MKSLFRILGLVIISAAIISSVSAQGDVRSATGLPIPIGAPVIWGQVELRGLQANEMRPVVVVTLLFNGAQLGTSQANDKGFWYFLQRPRDGAELVLRVGGTEIGRQVITSAGGDRYDMAVDWVSASQVINKAGVVSVKSAYTARSAANQKLLDKAIESAKSKKTGDAVKLLLELVASDPNDFVAWTELGSLYFGEGKLPDAEKAYGKALELKPDFMIALLNLGKLHLSNKAFDKAIAALEKAAIAEPTSADALHYLGEAYLQAKQGSKAVPVLNEAIRLAPMEKADIHLRLAALYNAAGLKDRAANEYKLFLQKRPGHSDKEKMEKYIKENLK